MTLLIYTLLGLILGAAGGYFYHLYNEKMRETKSDQKAESVVKAAKKEAEKLLEQASIQAEQKRQQIMKEADDRQMFIRDLEKSSKAREDSLDRRLTEAEKLRQDWERKNEEMAQIKEAVKEVREKQESSLVKIAKMTQEEAKQVLMNMVERNQKEDILKKMRELDEMTETEVEAEARKKLSTVLARISSEVTAESTVYSVTIPSDEMKGRLIGKEGRNIQAFEKATGVDLLIDDSPDTVLISSFDPVRREIGRVSLENLIKDGRVQPARIEEIVAKATEDVNTVIRKAGEAAAIEAKVAGLPKEVLRILGQLKFRTSYGQNQLAHVLEVSKIAGLIAEEIGADAVLARKAGLLHDLGKALDHDIKAPHHHISVDIVRKYNLGEDLATAILSHHDDVEPTTTEGWIIKAADAISGARPGARRGSYEEYVERLRELENVANNFPGVDKSFAIQAGREVRVFVRPGEIDDLEAAKLAKNIAAKIEAELSYPGQVKVNVIRETRNIAYAS